MDQYAEIKLALKSIRDFVRWGVSRFNEAELFFGHGRDNATDEAIHLVLHALHLEPPLSAELWSARLTDHEKQRVIELLEKRIIQRVPAAYLSHQAGFAGLSFYVDERVLVPRSPLAELIENGFAPWVEIEKINSVLELGTGCGCIAIATAMHWEHLQVDAVDISVDALAVAEKNRAMYALDERLELYQGDLFEPLHGQRYDLIISNPPYVDQAEITAMPIEFQHEPLLGLAAGDDGLDIVRRILAQAADYLNPNGFLIVEVGVSDSALIAAYLDLDFTWLEFERGGEGVFILSAAQLKEV